jgi:hypothetical protein
MTDLCLAAERCVDYDRRVGESALTDDLPICEGCLLAAELAVPALVLDYRDLEQHLPLSLGVWGDGQPPQGTTTRCPSTWLSKPASGRSGGC